MPQIVTQFLECSFQQVSREQRFELRTGRRQKVARPRCFKIASQKRCGHPRRPEAGPIGDSRYGVRNDMAAFLAEGCGVCGVVKRSQHPGHIAERRGFDPPFANRPTRVAFEIDDHEIFAGEQTPGQDADRRGNGCARLEKRRWSVRRIWRRAHSSVADNRSARAWALSLN